VTYASNVKTAGNTLLGIVNDILDFSKIEAGKMEIIPVEYDMSSVINDLVNMIQTKADSKGLALNIQMDKDIPKMLKGDEVRIKQVITNILSNAVKYTEKGSITFGISSEKIPDESDAVILNVWVKDTGIGIKKGDMKKLFLEFDRIDEEKNRHIEGTGLGMNITQRLLEMMGSTLNVESEYGHGSTFSFRLKQDVLKWIPLGDYEESYRNSLSERKKYKEKFIAPKAEVLMVDDNEMNRVVFQSLIKKTRVNIDLANDGDEGLSMLRKKKYDIVFLDHLMPGKDGVETLRELKAEPENPNIDTPMVCLTANAISGARGQYLSAGFNDYLSKPIDPDALEVMLMIYLPEDKVEYLNDEEDNKDNVESSSADEKEKLSPLSDNEHIDIDRGMNNSGTVDVYLSTLKIYYNSIDEKEKELEAFLSEEDYKNYTVKVHALKSSLRTIGAVQLGEEAQALEDAGKREDTGFIKEHHKNFMEKCMSLKAPLSEIFTEEENGIDKPIADPELLAKAYEEIKAAAEDMDCGKLEIIFEDMDRYGIPEKDAELWKKLRAASDAFDYSAILELL
nr:response regulator [Lachnospiraceae bacterium]